MIFAYYGLKSGFEATISLGFLSRVIILANSFFTFKVDFKEIISLRFPV